MADSISDICNRALSEIGARSQVSSISPPAPVGPESYQCGLWYNKMRRNLLRTAQWGFARYQVVLTQLGDIQDGTAPFPYLFKYAYPPDAIKLRYILPLPIPAPGTSAPNVSSGPLLCSWSPRRDCRWLVASDEDSQGNQIKVILSNVPNAVMVYTKDITDADLFDDLFGTALSCAIGAKITLPLTGNVGVKNSMMAATEKAIMDARAADGNEAVTFNDHTPDWISTRGWPPPSSYGPGYFPGAAGWGNWFGSNDNMNWSS